MNDSFADIVHRRKSPHLIWLVWHTAELDAAFDKPAHIVVCIPNPGAALAYHSSKPVDINRQPSSAGHRHQFFSNPFTLSIATLETFAVIKFLLFSNKPAIMVT